MTSPDLQRIFLQSALSRGVLSGNLMRLIWVKCMNVLKSLDNTIQFPDATDDDAWQDFINSVNKSIDRLDLELHQYTDEMNGKEMYAFVNKRGDEIARIATNYSVGEVVYFKAIVEQIMLAPKESFSVSSLSALREASAIKPKLNMTKTQAEHVLNSFVARGWLLKSKRGRYSLSSRTIAELLSYLKETYPDEVLECTVCHEVVTKGIGCLTENCKTRLHFHCFALSRRQRETCPTCNTHWPDQPVKPLKPVGEDAAKDSDDKRQVRIRSAAASDEGEEEEIEETQSGPSATAGPSRRSQRKTKTTVVVDEEEFEETPVASTSPRFQTRRGSRR